MVDVEGKIHSGRIAAQIKAFATNKNSSLNLSSEEGRKQVGKPITYEFIDGTISKTNAIKFAHNYSLLGVDQSGGLVTYALCAVAGDLVKAKLSEIMDGMTPADFGYNKLDPSEVGTDRATRRLAIQGAEDKLIALRERKLTLAQSLRQLGVTV